KRAVRKAPTQRRGSLRHCEERKRRSNPYFLCDAMDCFASLAMTRQLNPELHYLFLELETVSGPLRRRDHAVGNLGRIDPEVIDQPHVLAPDAVRDRGQQMHIEFGKQMRRDGDAPG